MPDAKADIEEIDDDDRKVECLNILKMSTIVYPGQKFVTEKPAA